MNLIDLASEVSRRVQIKSIRLMETNAHVDLSGESHPREVDSMIDVKTAVNRKAGKIRVSPHFSVSARNEERSDRQSPFRVEATFLLEYDFSGPVDDLTEEHFKAFGNLNGIYNGWPYWREYVQQITTRMGLPPLILPVYRPTKEEPASKPKAAPRKKTVARRKKSSG